MQQRNYLSQSALGVLLVIIALFVLYLIPEFDIGSFHFKRINLLADIIKKDTKPVACTDTTKRIKPIFADTCKTGITCIEDYTTDTSGMTSFFTALSSSHQQHVRIAWFGDSYVEGDIMLDPLRDSLQAIFGGSGVGFVPITSEVAGFRETIRHIFSGWKTYSIVGDRDDKHPLGFGGYTVTSKKDNTVLYKPINRQRLNQFLSAKVFYGNTKGSHILLNDDTVYARANSMLPLAMLSIDKPISSLTISVPDTSPVDLYGAAFEGTTGVSIDNYSMRGNSGIGLAYVNEGMYAALDTLHHYNLVVLSYGLNVASEKAKNYDWYVKGMTKVIKMIRRSFPNTSILLIGCSDRAEKIDGEYQTMPMLKELIDVQRQMAIDNKICFWNLFEAMGGDSTMVNWANMEKHPYANKDYTHLTFYGGKKVADIIMGTLLYEKQKYDRKKKILQVKN